MIKYVSGALLIAGACALGDSEPIRGTSDSLVNRLEVGMSSAEVAAIIGEAQFEARTSLDASRRCLSYIYDEHVDARFAHAVFDDDRLVEASDGHRTTCAVP